MLKLGESVGLLSRKLTGTFKHSDQKNKVNSIDAKNRVFDRVQYSFIMKVLNGLDIEGIFYKKFKKDHL